MNDTTGGTVSLVTGFWNVACDTGLSAIPDFIAFARTVSPVETVNGPVYAGEEDEGMLPSSV